MSQSTITRPRAGRRPTASGGPLRAGDRRGGVLPLVAVVMIALLAACALAIDLGMAFTARSEAQRVADAAALAGGSAFMDFGIAEASVPAEERAYDYALRNTVRNVPVDSSEVQVEVLPDSLKVRVTITRETLPTWFARIVGIGDVDVAARAAAQALQGGVVQCLKPFAVPDLWAETNTQREDVDGDGYWDDGEEWQFDPEAGDRYKRWPGENDPENPELGDETGYGSTARGQERDYGAQVQIKVSDPNSGNQLQPGIFFPLVLPEDPEMGSCSKGGGGSKGASFYRNNICACNNSAVEIGDSFDVEPGNMIGPTEQGVSELIAQDPRARWVNDEIVDSDFGPDGSFASPRVIKVALFDPTTQMQAPGRKPIVINNFALFFLEEQKSRKDPVTARFLYFASASGEGSGGQTGSLALYLRLVE